MTVAEYDTAGAAAVKSERLPLTSLLECRPHISQVILSAKADSSSGPSRKDF
ncbi:hypothetical protein ACU8MI_16165 [Rhizobium leguminosarum]